MWNFKCSLEESALPHTLHRWLRSPECARRWRRSELRCANWRAHTWQRSTSARANASGCDCVRCASKYLQGGGGELVITRSEPTPPTCDRYNVTKLVVLHCVVWFAVAKREPLSNHRIPNISFK